MMHAVSLRGQGPPGVEGVPRLHPACNMAYFGLHGVSTWTALKHWGNLASHGGSWVGIRETAQLRGTLVKDSGDIRDSSPRLKDGNRES